MLGLIVSKTPLSLLRFSTNFSVPSGLFQVNEILLVAVFSAVISGASGAVVSMIMAVVSMVFD